MSIVNDAMIVCRLCVSTFGNSRTDKIAGETVIREHNTDRSAGRYSKSLIDPAALKPVNAAATELRSVFIARTLPYNTGSSDSGERAERLIPARSFPKLETAIREKIADFEKQADIFSADVYPVELKRAGSRLGSLYDPDQYPGTAVIREEFSASMRSYPMPDLSKIPAGTWIGLSVESEQRMREQLAKETARAETAARVEVFKRIADQVRNISAKLSAFDPSAKGAERGIFRDSLIANLISEVAILPDLIPANGDPELQDILREIKGSILITSPKVLREDPKIRAEVKQSADRVVAKLAGIF